MVMALAYNAASDRLIARIIYIMVVSPCVSLWNNKFIFVKM